MRGGITSVGNIIARNSRGTKMIQDLSNRKISAMKMLLHPAHKTDIARRSHHLFNSLQNSLRNSFGFTVFQNDVEMRKIID